MGKSIFPVDSVVIDTTAVPASELVHGTADYSIKGQDTATTTADGKIHNCRTFVTKETSFELFGDRSELDTPNKSVGVPITLKYGTETVDTVIGVVTASYDDSRQTTQINITVDADNS